MALKCRRETWQASRPWGLVGCLVVVLAGCNRDPIQFQGNAVHAQLVGAEAGVPMDEALADVDAVLVDLFGTPDAPLLPAALSADPQLADFVQLERVRQAAGPFSSDQSDIHVGLYRKHCVNCHGVNGGGQGPAAALQYPYPRDYRMGIFKFKSTPRGVKPTREDLLRTLQEGMPGVAMPSFRLLAEEELDALIDYVIYLSMRGELERRMLAIAAEDLGYGEADGVEWLRPQERSGNEELAAEQQQWIDDELLAIASSWREAGERAVDPIYPSEQMLASAEAIEAGKQLFHGLLANCSSCHGPAGSGAPKSLVDYDDWTKEWTTKIGIDPVDREQLAEYRAAGAFRPRPIEARNLTSGVFRGGGRPEDIYLRITQGIDGTPMPAVNLVDEVGGAGVTREQVWQLVAYVLSLSPEGAVAPTREETVPSGETQSSGKTATSKETP